MIRLTRLNGTEFAVNADLVQRAEATPDTVVTLVDGSRYVVAEGLDEVIDRVADFRAHILRRARGPADDPTPPPEDAPPPAAGGDVVEMRPRRP